MSTSRLVTARPPVPGPDVGTQNPPGRLMRPILVEGTASTVGLGIGVGLGLGLGLPVEPGLGVGLGDSKASDPAWHRDPGSPSWEGWGVGRGVVECAVASEAVLRVACLARAWSLREPRRESISDAQVGCRCCSKL